MKLIKLKEVYDHYVIITDEEIKMDDIVLETRVDGSTGLEHIQTLNDIDPSSQKKVTHTSIPIIGLCLIDEDELKGLLKMKLYTEEQVKEMIDDAHNGIDGYYDILKKHTPIELPTDEEIEKAGAELFDKVVYIDYEWIMGAKWMRDKIKGGNK